MKTHIIRSYEKLESKMMDGRVTIIYGPRRVGKTTLVKKYLNKQKLRVLQDVGDNVVLRQLLSSQDLKKILEWSAGYDVIL